MKDRDKIKEKFEILDWFWFKSRCTNKAGHRNERAQKNFDSYLKIFLIEMQYTGQTKSEIQKNFKRIDNV